MKKKIPNAKQNIHNKISTKEQPENIYTLLYRIGKGSNSIIYKAIHKYTRQIFAIKIIKNQDKNNIISLKNKINLMKQLFNKSEYIIKYYGSYYSIKSNNFWIVLEYCSLGSITDFLGLMNRAYNEIEIATIISMILKGLKELKNNNIIFKNLKSSNILITEDGYIKLNKIFFEEINNQNEDNIDISNIGIICLELITGVKIENNLQQNETISNFYNNNNFYKKKYSKDFISFLNKCLFNNVNNNKVSILELLNHPFIVKKSKNKNYLSTFLIRYISYNDKYKNINLKKNINNRTKKSENKKKINKNINNIYFFDKNMGNIKNKTKNTESSLLILKDYIEKKNKQKPKYYTEEKLYSYYKKSDFLEQKDFYINNPIKRRILLIPKLYKNKNNFTKGIYINNISLPNYEINYELDKDIQKSTNNVLNNLFIMKNMNNISSNTSYMDNEEYNKQKIKCDIIKLTPNIQKNRNKIITNCNDYEIKKNISFDNIKIKNFNLKINNNINQFIINTTGDLSSFTFRKKIKENLSYNKNQQNTNNNINSNNSNPIRTYKANSKMKENIIEIKDTNIQIFNQSNELNDCDYLIKRYKSYDDIIDNNTDIFYRFQEFYNNLDNNEMTNKVNITNKMHKSHKKYFERI